MQTIVCSAVSTSLGIIGTVAAFHKDTVSIKILTGSAEPALDSTVKCTYILLFSYCTPHKLTHLTVDRIYGHIEKLAVLCF